MDQREEQNRIPKSLGRRMGGGKRELLLIVA